MILGVLFFLGVLGGEVFSISTDFDTLPRKQGNRFKTGIPCDEQT